MNACTRTTHRLTGKVSKNTEKFRLAFNQISLSEPNSQPQRTRRDGEILFHLAHTGRIGRIVENRDTSNFGNRFFEQLQPFTA